MKLAPHHHEVPDMVRKLTALLMLGAFLLLPLESAATTWTKVRYNGGAVQTKVIPRTGTTSSPSRPTSSASCSTTARSSISRPVR